MPKPTRQARVNLTLTDFIVSELQQWADQSGHTVTSLCAWLVKRSLDAAKKSKEFQSTEPAPDSLDLVRHFFDDVASGKYYSDRDLAKLANEVDVSVDHLIAHQGCFQKKGEKVGN